MRSRIFALFTALLGLALSAQVALADTSYTIQPGDTLFSIARRFGVTQQEIMARNGIANPALIFAGQTIVIPTAAPATAVPVTTPATSTAPVTPTLDVTGTMPMTASVPTTPTNPALSPDAAGVCPNPYTVAAGDTLRQIAIRCNTTIAALQRLNGLANPDLIFAGQPLRTVGAVADAPAAPAPATPTTSPRCGAFYIVQPGDKLGTIASRCGLTWQAIAQANGLTNPERILVGQRLVLPIHPAVKVVGAYMVKQGDTYASIAQAYGVTVEALLAANGLLSYASITPGQMLAIPDKSWGQNASGVCGATYTVQRGDTLTTIAQKCRVDPVKVAQVNRLTNASRIFVGQILQMP